MGGKFEDLDSYEVEGGDTKGEIQSQNLARMSATEFKSEVKNEDTAADLRPGQYGETASEDYTPDLAALLSAVIIISTPEKWDGISRNWHSRRYVTKVGLMILDEIHLLGADRGPILEVIVSRMRYISSQTDRAVRFVCLSTALANACDLAEWLGVGETGLFNFKPSVRPVPLEVHIQGYPGKFYCQRMNNMNKPAYAAAICTHSPTKPVLIFVSSRRLTRLTALDLIQFAASDELPRQFLSMPEESVQMVLSQVPDQNLRHTLQFGIGLHHAGLNDKDRSLVEELFAHNKIQVLVCTSTLAWGVNRPAHLVIIKIHDEAKKFAYQTGVKIVVAYGGAPISHQFRNLERGVDILVATPGRLVGMIERERVSLSKLKYLTLDEADRMLDMGFEPQIRKIVEQLDMPRTGAREAMLFSATFPDEIQRLAADFLSNYIFLSVGRVGSSTDRISQSVEYVEDMNKRSHLMQILRSQRQNGNHGKGMWLGQESDLQMLPCIVTDELISSLSRRGNTSVQQLLDIPKTTEFPCFEIISGRVKTKETEESWWKARGC